VAACAGQSQPECQGQVAVWCGGKNGVGALDCGASGLVCGQNASGVACGTATCDPTAMAPSCNGDSLVECSALGGVLQNTNCAFWMSTTCTGASNEPPTCTTQVANTCGTVGGVPQCVGNGPACDATTFQNACDGSIISTCTGGHVATFDCASYGLGLTCSVDTPDGANCTNLSNACPDGAPETCADGVITFCMFGAKATVDSKSFGLSGCKVSSTTPEAAQCTP
jgi:hypothetical protein